MTTLGSIIDALGVTADVSDSDLIAGAVVILKIVPAEGDAGLTIAVDDNCGWLEQLGIIEAARQIITTPCRCGGGDE